jgi:hypothetical protein
MSHISTLDQSRPPASVLRRIVVGRGGRLRSKGIVDSNNAGWWSSIAIDSVGHLHISYLGLVETTTTSYKLRYAFFDGAIWNLQELEDGGCSTSIAVDANDLPHISHVGGTNCSGDLRYLRFDGALWHAESTGQSGLYFGRTSLGLANDGSANVAFINPSRNVMRANNVGGTWIADQVAVQGHEPSLAIDPSGGLHVIFTNGADLDYASLNGSSWSSEVVFLNANGGSLAFDASGTPKVSFTNNIPGRLMYATRDASSWRSISLGGRNMSQTTIAIDPLGRPHIGAQLGVGGDFYLAYVAFY